MNATIMHRGWIITPAVIGYDIQHPDYDHDNEIDWRHGHADTVEGARVEIDRLLAEDAEWTEAASMLKTGGTVSAIVLPAQAGAASVEVTDETVMIPREPTQEMMDAGLHHSSHDAEWADVHTMWKAMFDAVTLDGGTSASAPAAIITPKASAETAIPQGWQMVPKKPTPAMVEAWANASVPAFLIQQSPDEEANALAAECDWTAMLSAAPRAPATEAGDMAWLSSQRRLSLSFYSPMYGDDDDQSEEWRVHKESGPINDREWDIVGRGATVADAVRAARAVLSATPTDQVKDAKGGGA